MKKGIYKNIKIINNFLKKLSERCKKYDPLNLSRISERNNNFFENYTNDKLNKLIESQLQNLTPRERIAYNVIDSGLLYNNNAELCKILMNIAQNPNMNYGSMFTNVNDSVLLEQEIMDDIFNIDQLMNNQSTSNSNDLFNILNKAHQEGDKNLIDDINKYQNVANYITNKSNITEYEKEYQYIMNLINRAYVDIGSFFKGKKLPQSEIDRRITSGKIGGDIRGLILAGPGGNGKSSLIRNTVTTLLTGQTKNVSIYNKLEAGHVIDYPEGKTKLIYLTGTSTARVKTAINLLFPLRNGYTIILDDYDDFIKAKGKVVNLMKALMDPDIKAVKWGEMQESIVKVDINPEKLKEGIYEVSINGKKICEEQLSIKETLETCNQYGLKANINMNSWKAMKEQVIDDQSGYCGYGDDGDYIDPLLDDITNNQNNPLIHTQNNSNNSSNSSSNTYLNDMYNNEENYYKERKEIPPSFFFSSKMLFITNASPKELDPAVFDRFKIINYSFTQKQQAMLMRVGGSAADDLVDKFNYLKTSDISEKLYTIAHETAKSILYIAQKEPDLLPLLFGLKRVDVDLASYRIQSDLADQILNFCDYMCSIFPRIDDRSVRQSDPDNPASGYMDEDDYFDFILAKTFEFGKESIAQTLTKRSKELA